MLTVTQAAALTGLDKATIRRDRLAKKYPGAVQASGQNRGTWLIPLADLVAAGRIKPKQSAADPTEPDRVADLRNELRAEQQAHAETRARLAAAEAVAAVTQRHADAVLAQQTPAATGATA